MLPDISTRAHIELLMERFYAQAIPDAEIGHFFTQVAPLHLPSHLPIIADFWESILLQKPGVYTRNAMQPHLQLHHKSPIMPQHLQRWVQLFSQTVDSLFEGPTATLAKQRAQSIATLMQIKINQIATPSL
ncbi:MAG TPA: group III truncated hemoglobin [Phnomibacter sp.]|nr:group III truncated hemoglobin [Phnomibacter sp.]